MIEKLAYNEQTVAKMIGVTVKKLRDWRDDVAVLPFVTVGRGKAIYRVGDVHLLICTDSYHRWLHWRMSLAFQAKLLPSPLS